MLTFQSGESVTITVPLRRDGEPFVADAGATWTLRDQAGLPVPAYMNQPIADLTDSSVQIIVPAIANAVDPTRRFEKRFVVVKGLTGGEPFSATTPYRLTPWLNFTASIQDYWAFVGTDGGEFADFEVDLAAAYFNLSDVVTDAKLQTALASGGQKEQIANRAIVGQAVLDTLSGLRQRIAKKANDGSMSIERFEVDFDKMALDAGRAVQDAAVIVGEIVVDTTVGPTIFILAGPTEDPITGTTY